MSDFDLKALEDFVKANPPAAALRLRHAVKPLAERAVQARELTHAKAKLALDKYVLRAPEDGTVLRVTTQVGETLGEDRSIIPEPARLFPEDPLDFAQRLDLGELGGGVLIGGRDARSCCGAP